MSPTVDVRRLLPTSKGRVSAGSVDDTRVYMTRMETLFTGNYEHFRYIKVILSLWGYI